MCNEKYCFLFIYESGSSNGLSILTWEPSIAPADNRMSHISYTSHVIKKCFSSITINVLPIIPGGNPFFSS